MTTWAMEEQTGGSVVVTWKRRRKTFRSQDEALRFIREHRSPEDRVIQVHKDGYRSTVTRKKWRKRGFGL